VLQQIYNQPMKLFLPQISDKTIHVVRVYVQRENKIEILFSLMYFEHGKPNIELSKQKFAQYNPDKKILLFTYISGTYNFTPKIAK
jgi:hypothetical protein